MNNNQFYTTSQAAKILGLSRMQITRKIHKSEITAIRVGRSFLIPKDQLNPIFRPSSESDLRKIDEGVIKTVKEYGDVLKKLGKE